MGQKEEAEELLESMRERWSIDLLRRKDATWREIHDAAIAHAEHEIAEAAQAALDHIVMN